MEFDNDQGMKGDDDPGAGLGERMSRLYDEANAVKMLNFRRILQAQAAGDPKSRAEALQSSQMALKAIKLQLNILAEEVRRNPGKSGPVQLAAMWEAMLGVPALKSLVSRGAVRDQVMEQLGELMEEKPGRGMMETEGGEDFTPRRQDAKE